MRTAGSWMITVMGGENTVITVEKTSKGPQIFNFKKVLRMYDENENEIKRIFGKCKCKFQIGVGLCVERDGIIQSDISDIHQTQQNKRKNEMMESLTL